MQSKGNSKTSATLDCSAFDFGNDYFKCCWESYSLGDFDQEL